ncbi:MAG: hypothetical protein Q9217_006647 [Psora testacea]
MLPKTTFDKISTSRLPGFKDDHRDDPPLPSMPVHNTINEIDASHTTAKAMEAAGTAEVDEQKILHHTSSSSPGYPPPLYTPMDDTAKSNQASAFDIDSMSEPWEEDRAWDSTCAEIGDDDSVIDRDLGDSGAASVTSQVFRTSNLTLKAPTQPVTLAKGWPIPDYYPSQPFPWFQLPADIRHEVLGYLLVSSDTVRPYFNAGSVRLVEHECRYENIDASLLYTGEKEWNKQWYEDATDVLYGENVFEFKEPRVARWWCERIGRNLKKVKKMVVTLSGGYVQVPTTRKSHTTNDNMYNTRNEFLWLKLLHFLRPRHDFFAMHIDFRAWNRLNMRHVRWWRNCGRWRQEILLCLLQYRGLAAVRVEEGTWYDTSSSDIFRDLERAMMLADGEECAAAEALRALIQRDEREQGLKGRGYSFK